MIKNSLGFESHICQGYRTIEEAREPSTRESVKVGKFYV